MPIPILATRTGLSFAVRVVPRAGRTEAAGVRSGALLVRLAAPPVDGAANDALIAFLAEAFGRPKRDVVILSGLTGRQKRVEVSGMQEAGVRSRLEALAAGPGSRGQ